MKSDRHPSGCRRRQGELRLRPGFHRRPVRQGSGFRHFHCQGRLLQVRQQRALRQPVRQGLEVEQRDPRTRKRSFTRCASSSRSASSTSCATPPRFRLLRTAKRCGFARPARPSISWRRSSSRFSVSTAPTSPPTTASSPAATTLSSCTTRPTMTRSMTAI